MYQLQKSSDLEVWTDADGPKFAASDQITVGVALAETANYYRVIRIRQ